jgi:hypothetical protein
VSPTLVWICWSLVALGVILVVASVIPLSGRVRPLRRARRRLSWRQADLARLRTRTEGLQDQLIALQAQALEVAQRRADHGRDRYP